jgi:hypothetical protein
MSPFEAAPKPLSPPEIVEVKRRLSDNQHAIEAVCSRLAIEEEERLNGTDLKKGFRYGRVEKAVGIGIGCYVTIQEAVAAPESGEWPETATVSPERVGEELDLVLSMEHNG